VLDQPCSVVCPMFLLLKCWISDRCLVNKEDFHIVTDACWP